MPRNGGAYGQSVNPACHPGANNPETTHRRTGGEKTPPNLLLYSREYRLFKSNDYIASGRTGTQVASAIRWSQIVWVGLYPTHARLKFCMGNLHQTARSSCTGRWCEARQNGSGVTRAAAAVIWRCPDSSDDTTVKCSVTHLRGGLITKPRSSGILMIDWFTELPLPFGLV